MTSRTNIAHGGGCNYINIYALPLLSLTSLAPLRHRVRVGGKQGRTRIATFVMLANAQERRKKWRKGGVADVNIPEQGRLKGVSKAGGRAECTAGSQSAEAIAVIPS